MTDDEIPPLRDRNRFFNSLLNGDRMTYERVAPVWKERRRNERKAKRAAKWLREREAGADRRTLAPNDPRFQEQGRQVERDRKVKWRYRRLYWSTRAARRRVQRLSKRRTRDEATRTAVIAEATKIARRVRSVRERALRLSDARSPDSPLALRDVRKLEIEFPGAEVADKVRKRQYTDAAARLRTFEDVVRAINRGIRKRRRDFRRARRGRHDRGF